MAVISKVNFTARVAVEVISAVNAFNNSSSVSIVNFFLSYIINWEIYKWFKVAILAHLIQIAVSVIYSNFGYVFVIYSHDQSIFYVI